jgi:hypothetical protein
MNIGLNQLGTYVARVPAGLASLRRTPLPLQNSSSSTAFVPYLISTSNDTSLQVPLPSNRISCSFALGLPPLHKPIDGADGSQFMSTIVTVMFVHEPLIVSSFGILLKNTLTMQALQQKYASIGLSHLANEAHGHQVSHETLKKEVYQRKNMTKIGLLLKVVVICMWSSMLL